MKASMRQLNVLFCDDVRYEVGNKVTYVGVYNGTMEFAGKPPFTLPKLCISATSITPLDNPFKRLHLRVLVNDTVVQEIEVPEDQLVLKEVQPADIVNLAIGAVITVQPFVITEDCRVKVVAITETGEEMSPPGIKIRFLGGE